MAVTVDAVGANLLRNQVADNTNTTGNITIASGATIALVFVEASLSGGNSDAAITFPTFTLGGQACTQVASARKHSGSDAGTTGFVDIYYLLAPPSGVQTLSITLLCSIGGTICNLNAFAVSYLGSGTSAPTSVAGGRANGNSVSSLTISDGELFAGVACNGTSAPTVTTGTSDATATGDTSTSSHGGIRVAHSAGAGSITFGTNSGDSSGATGVKLAAASAGASTPTVALFGPGSQGPLAFQWQQIIGVTATGGTQFNITPTGTTTPAGALAKQVAKLFAGSSTPTGSIVKAIAKATAGTTTPTGALALLRVLLRTFTGTVTPTGSLVRQTSKGLAGTVTPTGAATKAVAKAFAGAVTPAGSVRKLVAKALAGTITPTGTLTTVRVILRTFTGTITPSGALAKAVAKSLAGALAPAGSLRRTIVKALVGLIAPIGTLVTSGGQVAAPTTPLARIWRIAAEHRGWHVQNDDRTLRVPDDTTTATQRAEDRTWHIPPDDRREEIR